MMLVISVIIAFFQLFPLADHSNTLLREGLWRGVLKLSDSDLPFNFRVTNNGEGLPVIEILNGEENIKVDEIRLEQDSVFIQMPVFDSEFRLHFDSQRMSGIFINHARASNNIFPFKAEYGISYRFPTNGQPPSTDLSGKWECDFSKGTADSSKAIGIFHQEGSKLSGTFLTTTGDDRYLEGSVQADHFMMSSFDGSHLFLFKGNVEPNGSISGIYYSGNHWKETWVGIRNENYELPDPFTITALQPGFTKVDFTFPDEGGKQVSLNDPEFKNKVVIVQITGSWCPNCMDETAYYASLYKQYQKQGLEIIALDFEKVTDTARIRQNLQRLKNRFNIDYPILYAGQVGDEAGKALPMINGIHAYPTSIFIDKQGRVRKIYTGINGPATGSSYEKWKDDTENLVLQLLKEKE